MGWFWSFHFSNDGALFRGPPKLEKRWQILFISLNQFQSHVEYTCISLAHVFSNKIFMLFHSKNLQVVAVKVSQMI